MPAKSTVVRFRAHDGYEVRIVELVKHPSGPCFRRSATHILVENTYNTISAKLFGERENFATVLGGFVGVTEENFRIWSHVLHHFSKKFKSRQISEE